MSLKGRKKDLIEQFIGLPQPFLSNSLAQLRYLLLVEGLSVPPGYDQCPYRSAVWSILLRVPPVLPSHYESLVHSVPKLLSTDVYAKIKNDTFRTMMHDTGFHQRVSEDALVRILAVHALDPDNRAPYVQGLNVLLAPIAYCSYKSEPQAYGLLHLLISHHIPLYITPNLDGVHTALSLVDILLRLIDPALAAFLDSKFLRPEIYAFPSVLTLCACTPPLHSVLVLWDFLFAYGTHMNILFIVAQLIIHRHRLLKAEQPMKILRNFPPLLAHEIIKLALSFIPEIPDPVYDMIARHGHDPSVKAQVSEWIKRE